MATFVHIADERMARRILRGGIRATELVAVSRDTKMPRCGVFCVPVVPNFQTTFQWLRELKRRGHKSACGVQFRIDDSQAVFVGHYNGELQEMTAARSITWFLQAKDTRGLQVVIPRAIPVREIMRLRSIPQVTGWRFYPAAKGKPPLWPAKGEANASRLRRSFERQFKAP